MTDFGRKQGDMLRSVYDPNKDGVLAVAQTEADMTKAVYDPTLATIVALLANHNAEHESGGDDEIDCTGLTGAGAAGILGDGTAGRVMRCSHIKLEDGTNDNTVKATLTANWNGDSIAETDNIPLNGEAGHFGMDATGGEFFILPTGVTGNIVAALACNFRMNETTVDITFALTTSAGKLRIQMYRTSDGLQQNISSLLDTGRITALLLYLTDA